MWIFCDQSCSLCMLIRWQFTVYLLWLTSASVFTVSFTALCRTSVPHTHTHTHTHTHPPGSGAVDAHLSSRSVVLKSANLRTAVILKGPTKGVQLYFYFHSMSNTMKECTIVLKNVGSESKKFFYHTQDSVKTVSNGSLWTTLCRLKGARRESSWHQCIKSPTLVCNLTMPILSLA